MVINGFTNLSKTRVGITFLTRDLTREMEDVVSSLLKTMNSTAVLSGCPRVGAGSVLRLFIFIRKKILCQATWRA